MGFPAESNYLSIKEVGMKTPRNKSSRLASTIRWVAKILCILAIVFISLFAVDVFTEGASLNLGQKIVAFLMHMIPSFVLIIALIIAWKNEFAGGILIALVGLATSPFVYNRNYIPHHSVSQALLIVAMINVPFIIVGVLFIISYFLHPPKKLTTQTP
jgi:lysylphosphatidylglycerol synthetase-like protein (DUF2156 family)